MNPELKHHLHALEAERLAPLPRATHVVAVDVDDLIVLLEHVRRHAPPERAPLEVAEVYDRLERAARRQPGKR